MSSDTIIKLLTSFSIGSLYRIGFPVESWASNNSSILGTSIILYFVSSIVCLVLLVTIARSYSFKIDLIVYLYMSFLVLFVMYVYITMYNNIKLRRPTIIPKIKATGFFTCDI